jgi:hypothetical protein
MEFTRRKRIQNEEIPASLLTISVWTGTNTRPQQRTENLVKIGRNVNHGLKVKTRTNKAQDTTKEIRNLLKQDSTAADMIIEAKSGVLTPTSKPRTLLVTWLGNQVPKRAQQSGTYSKNLASSSREAMQLSF